VLLLSKVNSPKGNRSLPCGQEKVFSYYLELRYEVMEISDIYIGPADDNTNFFASYSLF